MVTSVLLPDRFAVVPSPVDDLVLTGHDGGLAGCFFAGPGTSHREARWQGLERDDDAFAEVVVQLGEYFAGTRTAFDFDLALAPTGTEFQQRVWLALRTIPYGETRSYGELARTLGQPTASRAVGLANGANPLSIVVPCHRVIGADGRLTGFGGGIERKRFLLDLESGSLPFG